MNASRNHLKFGTFTREDAKRWPYLFLKSFQNVSTNHTKFHDFGVKGYQNQPKGCPGELRKRSWKQVGSGTPKKCQRQVRGTRFWVPYGRSWAPFWVPLGAKGSQNQVFWRQDAPKSQNMISRMRHQKQFVISTEICSENVSF